MIISMKEEALGECASGRVGVEEAPFMRRIMELSVFFSSWLSPLSIFEFLLLFFEAVF